MTHLQCGRNLLKDLQAFLNRHRPPTQALLKSVSLDSFQNQKVRLIFLIKVMNRSAIETIQLHSHHRFALKAGHAFLAADKLKWSSPTSIFTVGPGVSSTVNFTHLPKVRSGRNFSMS